MSTKTCSKCNESLPITDFRRAKGYKDGFFCWCRKCTTAYDRERRYNDSDYNVRRLEHSQKWKKNNKDKLKKYRQKKDVKNNQKERMESPVLFKEYVCKLNYAEEIRGKDGILEIRCSYCGKWYLPTLQEVTGRIRALEGRCAGELRLYCSVWCKQECPIYNQKKISTDILPQVHKLRSEGKMEKEIARILGCSYVTLWKIVGPRKNKKNEDLKLATSREVQPELRQLVFERDKWTCQRCGATTSLHCHHITGVEQNPIESADIDNCVTLCKKCHKWVHTLEGCRYFELRRCA